MIRSVKRAWPIVLAIAGIGGLTNAIAAEEEGQVRVAAHAQETTVSVAGSPKDEWRFQTAQDLRTWMDAPALKSVYSGSLSNQEVTLDLSVSSYGFIRAVKTAGLFDTHLLRTIHLTFTNPNWAIALANGRTRGTNTPGTLHLDNGVMVTTIGARYKGNTSFQIGGNKKSVNLDINWTDPESRVMGYRAINLNNAAGDSTLMREPLYFNVMREYAPSPHGALARLVINGADWGVYSMVDQINNDLLDDWFPGHDGDRWRAPNVGGAAGGGGPGGGFDSAASAFSYLGTNVARYTNNYELKSANSTNAWKRLVHAIDVLNNTATNALRNTVEEVFAVDRWLWFLAVENVFVDDDSYWNKGADYAFYYEPESGRIHPVEHDGNEAFTSAMGATVTLSPLQGMTGSNRPLLYRLLRINELRQRYLAHMRTILAERFNPDYLTPVIDHFHQLSAADIANDPKKNFTMSAYTNALRALRAYVTNRHTFLTNHAELRPLAPVILGVRGPAAEVGPADIPTITAEVHGSGSEGVESVWLYWRDKPYGRFTAAPMFDDGAHNDGMPGDGTFAGVTTNFPAGHKIHYYIEARANNAAQAAAFSPIRAEEATYDYRVGLISATNKLVVINEIMPSNRRTLADPQGDFDDWIELRNLTDEPVDLSGTYLTDDASDPRRWAFPSATVIPAHGYLLVWADGQDLDTPGLHANFKLDADGEELYLIGTDANLNEVLDSVRFGPSTADQAFGRSGANEDTWTVLAPTPNGPNP